MQQIARLIALALVLVGLNGCSTTTVEEDTRVSVYLEHAGEPVNQVFVGGFIRDWQPVGADTVRMEFNRQRHYLIEFAPPCPSVLRGVTTMQLIPARDGYLGTFDQVRMGDVSCRIQSIRELDYEAIQRALAQ